MTIKGAVLVPGGKRGTNWQQSYTARGDIIAEVLSACIKEIRFGNEENSLFWALEMCDAGTAASDFLWECLKVCSVEDIGLADPTALATVAEAKRLYDELPAGDSRRNLALAHVILYLCRARKTRYVNELLMVIQERRKFEEYHLEIPDRAIDMHTLKGRSLGRGLHHYLTEGASLSPETEDTSFGIAYRQKLIRGCKPL
ncbi:MAG: hypothetical protein WAV21_01075 [Minisyncoccia bacterium]